MSSTRSSRLFLAIPPGLRLKVRAKWALGQRVRVERILDLNQTLAFAEGPADSRR